jgi:hypothetical protein
MNDPVKFALADGLDLAGIDVDELWWRYTANGGRAGTELLAARVAGTAPCDPDEHDLIAQTLNECFIDKGLGTFPVRYARRREALPALAADQRRQTRLDSVRAKGAARARALDARRRSALAARQAAALQETAAHLFQAGGRLDYARHASERAASARTRGNVQREPALRPS